MFKNLKVDGKDKKRYKHLDLDTLIIFEIIENLLDCGTKSALGCTCKYFFYLYKKQYPLTKLGAITLFPSQYRTLQMVAEKWDSGKRIVNVNAPMDYGKTIIGLYSVFGEGLSIPPSKHALILTKPSAMPTWEQKIVEYLGTDYYNGSEDSYTYTTSSKKKNHVIKADNLPKLVISSYRTLIKVSNCKFDLVVVDEAHSATNDHVNRILNFTNSRLLLLSAEGIYTNRFWTALEKKGYFKTEIIKVNRLQWQTWNVNFWFYPQSLPIDKTVSTVKMMFRKGFRKGVVFYPFDNLLADELENYDGIIYFKYVESMKVVQKFREYKGKCVLITSQAHSESLNFLGDFVVLVKPSSHTAVKYSQSVGRLMRPENPFKTIQIVVIDSPESVVRILYYEAHRRNKEKYVDRSAEHYNILSNFFNGLSLNPMDFTVEEVGDAMRMIFCGSACPEVLRKNRKVDSYEGQLLEW